MAELDPRKAALIAQLDRARAEMGAHGDGARAQTDVNAKLRSGFQRNRLAWIGSAAVVGLALAKLPPRSKKVVVRRKGGADAQLMQAGKAGMALGVVKLALDFAKPLLIAWATKRMGDVARTAKKTEQKVARTEQKVAKVDAKT